MTYTDPLRPPVYARARCYPVPGGYHVELHPLGSALPGPGWPHPRDFPTLAAAMAWAYAAGTRPGLALDGLTLSATAT
jgi:hypothetical protein